MNNHICQRINILDVTLLGQRDWAILTIPSDAYRPPGVTSVHQHSRCSRSHAVQMALLELQLVALVSLLSACVFTWCVFLTFVGGCVGNIMNILASVLFNTCLSSLVCARVSIYCSIRSFQCIFNA